MGKGYFLEASALNGSAHNDGCLAVASRTGTFVLQPRVSGSQPLLFDRVGRGFSAWLALF